MYFNLSRLMCTLRKKSYDARVIRPLLKPSCVSIVNKLLFHREVNEKVEAKLKFEDRVPDSYRIIYRAPLKNYVKMTYYTTFSSLLIVVPLLASSVYFNGLGTYPVMVSNIELIHSFGEFCGFIAGLTLMTFQVCVVVFKYPFRIYKNSEKKHYIAVYQHLLPWKHQKEEFAAGQAKRSTFGVMPWKHSLYDVNKKKAILIEHSFTTPAELNEMLQIQTKGKKSN